MNTPLVSLAPDSAPLHPTTRRWHSSEFIALVLFVAVLAAELAVIVLAAPHFDGLSELYTVT